MTSMMVETTTKMVEQWKHNLSNIGSMEVDVEREISVNAAEIIANITFGTSSEEGKQVFEKLQILQTTLFKSNRLVGVPLSSLLYPNKTNEAKKLGNEIDHLLLSIIDSRMEARKQTTTTKSSSSSSSSSSSTVHSDLLGMLLASNEDNAATERKLTRRELVDECKTFFFAGHETTALALTWTLFLLALYPDWQKKLRDEIMEVSQAGATLDDPSSMLPKLKQMECVFNEVLRLYCPAPNNQRQAREDVRVGDIVIPKGTNMWVDVVGMHHDASLWGDDVNEFRPDRFLNSLSGGCKHRKGFSPFGFGGRICIGRNLTLTEYKLVLTHLLTNFSMSLSPSYLHSPRIMLSLRPSRGVPLIITSLQPPESISTFSLIM